MRTNSELRQAVQHHITNKEINLDAVRAEFGEGSEEYGFAVRYIEHNSKTLGEKFMNIFPEGNGNGDDVSLESAIEANKPRTTRQIIIPSPWDDMGQDRIVTIDIETGEEIEEE